MNGRTFMFRAPSNPLMQILALLVFGVFLVAAVVLGAFILAVLVGVVAIAAVVFSVRGWWLRRKSGPNDDLGAPPGAMPRGPAANGGRVIDAEYVVLEQRPRDAERNDGEPRS